MRECNREWEEDIWINGHKCKWAQSLNVIRNRIRVVKHKITMGKYTEKQNHNVKYKQVNLIRNNNNITQCNSSMQF